MRAVFVGLALTPVVALVVLISRLSERQLDAILQQFQLICWVGVGLVLLVVGIAIYMRLDERRRNKRILDGVRWTAAAPIYTSLSAPPSIPAGEVAGVMAIDEEYDLMGDAEEGERFRFRPGK